MSKASHGATIAASYQRIAAISRHHHKAARHDITLHMLAVIVSISLLLLVDGCLERFIIFGEIQGEFITHIRKCIKI